MILGWKKSLSWDTFGIFKFYKNKKKSFYTFYTQHNDFNTLKSKKWKSLGQGLGHFQIWMYNQLATLALEEKKLKAYN